MFRIGAHVSISDGFAAAVNQQNELGGTCGQCFVGSPRTWAVSSVDADAAAAFKEAVEAQDIRPWIVHGTYLINFATPKDDLAAKSVDTVQAELDACDALGIPYYTFHPGAHTGAGVEQGLANIGDRLSQLDIPESVTLLLENTAGKGTTLGKTMEQLDAMVQQAAYGYDDIGVCLDSCHLYAAGNDFTTQDGIDDLVERVDAHIGVEHVHYLHLNDSKHPLGSEKDEHQHLGEGAIGPDGFRNLINHDAFQDLPMVVETPVNGKGFEWNIRQAKDMRNIDTAKELRED